MKKTFLLAATIFCFTNFINAQAGQLDPSFGINGVVKTDIGKSYNRSHSVYKILPLPDGSMYTIEGEDFGRLKKRLSNGRLDSSFGSNGNFEDSSFGFSNAAIQPDGKIVAAGGGIVRYNTNGKLDTTFSQNGKRTLGWIAHSIAIQKDGKIVVAGDSANHLALARYNTDGSPDATFNGNGMVNSNLSYNQFFSGDITTIALQNDGKIVAAGAFSMVRYNADGTEDKTFNGNGVHAFQAYLSVVIQSDEKIAAVGLTYDEESASLTTAICRLNTDGTFDKSFSGDGMQQPDNYDNYEAITLALQKDDKIVTVGTVTNYEGFEFFGVTRYKTDGEPDSSFSDDGKQTTDFGYKYSKPISVAIQSDGKILVGGSTNYSSTIAFARYNTNGSLDNTFGEDGKLTQEFKEGYTVYKKITVQKDGKIITGGTTWNGNGFEIAIARYNTDGSLDKTLSNDGILTTGISLNNYSSILIAVQNDGKILVTSEDLATLVRYNNDGSLDTAFHYNNNGQIIRSLAFQKDGKIVTEGPSPDGTFEIRRYNTTGSLDNTFGRNGIETVVYNDKEGYELQGFTSSIAMQSDGKILVGGYLARAIGYDNSSVALIRLNTNGSLDNTFSNDGKASFPLIGANSSLLAIQNDGKIVIGGDYSDHISNYAGVSLRRFNTDGTIDSTFNSKLRSAYSFSSTDRSSIALQNNGKILVLSFYYLLRLNAEGSVDSTFNINAKHKVDFYINDIAISNNKLYAVGGGLYGTVARYLLDSSNTPPTVILTSPADSTTRLAPAAHIRLSAAASDQDGTITKVEFYNGNTLLHTETAAPYGYVWRNVGLGNYTITAKAYDNSGNVTTSAPVHISVVPNKPPIVSITSPADNQTFGDTATIHFEAAASDTDGRIANVKFYNGATLLRTEFTYPYTYNWTNAAAGTYTVTAVATDNWGAHTTSAPVSIIVTSSKEMIVSNKPYSKNGKTASKDALSLSLYPNPSTNIVNLYTSGLKQNKPADISIISISGIVLKKVQISRAVQMQVDVSSLAKGVYTIKIVSGDKVMYKQFVKL